jgi:histidyl-tRNA synthetase
VETPILEHTRLFVRSLGAGSDVVMKEMYTLQSPRSAPPSSSSSAAAGGAGPSADEGSLTLRPEGTAGVVRAVVAGGGVQQLRQLSPSAPGLRLWYEGPMFRHERPQKGRYRQFTQLGVEAFNATTPAAAAGGQSCSALVDAELISAACKFLTQTLPVASAANPHAPLRLQLHLNSLGNAATMEAYSARLSAFLEDAASRGRLSADSSARLRRHAALRVLDSKDPADVAALRGAPRISECWTPAVRRRFEEVQSLVSSFPSACGVVLDEGLVRGLDYYCHTIFEFKVASNPQAQAAGAGGKAALDSDVGQLGTVLAGGRYDGLVSQFGGPATVAGMGWAAGLERLHILRTQFGAPEASAVPPKPRSIAVMPIQTPASAAAGAEAPLDATTLARHAFRCAESLRTLLQGRAETAVEVWQDARPIKKQLAAASKEGYDMVVMIGEDEVRGGFVTVKHMSGQTQSPSQQPHATQFRAPAALPTASHRLSESAEWSAALAPFL